MFSQRGDVYFLICFEFYFSFFIVLNNPVVELEVPEDAGAIKDGSNVQLMCEADIGSGEVQYHWFRY